MDQATNELEIKATGFAWGQIADMQAWYAELKADPGKLGGGQAFSVTGYSLGGHLATAFNLLNAGEAQRVVTFNGAGVGLVRDGSLQGALDEFNGLRGNSDALAARFTEDGLAVQPATTRRFRLKPARWRRALASLSLALAGSLGAGSPLALAATDASSSKVQQQSMKERQRIAAEMFRERCKKAGVFIHRTVENVEGVFLMKIRPKGVNYGNQYELNDPYGSDLMGGGGYILSFLKGYFQATTTQGPNRPPDAPADPIGYAYAEAIDPKDNVRYRYTGSVKAVRKKKIDAPNVQLELKRNPDYDLNIYEYLLERIPSKDARPRYGVTYDDISTREERDYWIAGSSLKVIDLQTNEVIAERIGYMVDWAQGISLGGRSPWLLAADNACPEFAARHGATSQMFQTIRFVNKSLKPKGD